MKRIHLILGGLLGLQLLLIVVLRLPLAGGAGTAAVAAPLVSPEEATDVVRIQIEDGDEGQVTLVRRDEHFVVEEAEGFPADASRIDELLADLRGLRVRRPVVSTPRHHATFKVADDDFEARVRLWTDPAGEPTVVVLVGTSANSGGNHIRRGDDAAVYEASDLSVYDLRTEPSAWIDRTIFAVAVDRVETLKIENALGAFTLARSADSWSVQAPSDLVGRAVEADAVEAILRTLTQLRWAQAVERPDPAEAGLDAPVVTVEITAPERHVLRVGLPVPGRESERYAMRTELDLAGSIWDSSLTPLLEAEISQLLAPAQP